MNEQNVHPYEHKKDHYEQGDEPFVKRVRQKAYYCTITVQAKHLHHKTLIYQHFQRAYINMLITPATRFIKGFKVP